MTNQKQYQLKKSSTMTAVDTLAETTSQNLALIIAEAADDRKAGDIVLLDVAEVSYLTDYFVIVTGFSPTQLRAICDSIEEKVEKEFQRHPLRIEGKTEGSWIVLDYGEAIVHIMLPREREFYNLEAFWGHAKRINFQPISEPIRD
jgi:ribosome-associated protein